MKVPLSRADPVANNTTQAVTTNYAGTRKSSLVYPNGRGIHYSYHDGGPLESISDTADHANPIVTYEYIGGRTITKMMQNGILLDMRGDLGSFDDLGRPSTYAWGYIYNDADPEDPPEYEVDTKMSFVYGYDRAGNKTLQYLWPNVNDSQRYAYDSANRLTAYNRGTYVSHTNACENLGATWSDQTIARRWALDGLGNWQSLETKDSTGNTSESRLSTTFNEYSKVDGNAQAHDDNGNLTYDGNQHYQWDAFNRLRVALDDSLTTLGVYSYDAGNRRMRKVSTIDSNTNTTDFYYVNWQVLEEKEISGSNMPTTPYRQFVYGNYIDEPVIMDVNENTSTDSYTTGSADSRYFYLQNTLYSVYALTDKDQDIIEAYEYDPYGTHVLLTDGDSDGYVEFNATDTRTEQGVSGIGNLYAFTSRRQDEETVLLYCRYRPLDTVSGRYITADPLGVSAGLNVREYLWSAPLSGLDPLGLDPGLGIPWPDAVYHPVTVPPSNPIKKIRDKLVGAKCCNNNENHDEWAIIDAHWVRLKPGECTPEGQDCDGMTCAGGFYAVGATDAMLCKAVWKTKCGGDTKLKLLLNDYRKRWVPDTDWGSECDDGATAPNMRWKRGRHYKHPDGYEWDKWPVWGHPWKDWRGPPVPPCPVDYLSPVSPRDTPKWDVWTPYPSPNSFW